MNPAPQTQPLPPATCAEASPWRQWWRLAQVQFSPEVAREQSADLCRQIRDWPLLQGNTPIAAFWPLPSEVQIQPLLREWAKSGRLLLPRTSAAGSMEFCRVQDPDNELSASSHRFQEPSPQLAPHTDPILMYLVPGLVFGMGGERIGRGAGFYDRHLDQGPGTIAIGVCYSWQLQPALPQSKHDFAMNYIITPNAIHKGRIL